MAWVAVSAARSARARLPRRFPRPIERFRPGFLDDVLQGFTHVRQIATELCEFRADGCNVFLPSFLESIHADSLQK